MDRNGNMDEKPTYQELASALRRITFVPKNYAKESKEQQLKTVLSLAKEVVSVIDRVEARQYKDIKFGEGV